MSRRTARDQGFKLLYQVDIHKGNEEEILETFFDENKVTEKDRTYIQEVVHGTLEVTGEIDKLIESNAKGWKINRISKVNLAILRLAIFEILKRDDIPISVSINEAVELAKNYDNEKSGAFVNGVLGAIQKTASFERIGGRIVNSPLLLGIDTSCYTTSIAIVNEENELIFNDRIVLSVKEGARGLRQSDALFQHIKNLPELVNRAKQSIDFSNIKKISVSERPRPVSDSYMPVFMGGTSFAKVIAETLDIPIQYFSHQEGHIMAGLWSAKAQHLNHQPFLCFHISGGTTELLHVNSAKDGFEIKIIGGTKDVHAGQFIDRIGVSMSLPFPCGPHLEKIALETENSIPIPVSVKHTWIHFSGSETHAQRQIIKGENHQSIALGVLRSIATSVEKVVINAVKETGIKDVLMVGGVCANTIMKAYLLDSLKGKATMHFAEPAFSTDNAVGIALLGNVGYNDE